MPNRIEELLDTLAGSKMPRIALCVFAALLGLTALTGLVQMAYAWTGNTPPAAIASIDVWKMGMVVGTAGTSATLLITLYIAERDYFISSMLLRQACGYSTSEKMSSAGMRGKYM